MIETIQLLSIFVLLLLGVAFFSLFERKVLSLMQYRKGPNKVGVGGFFQPFADALKLLLKEEGSPFHSVALVYYFPPIFLFFVSCLFWVSSPFFFGLISMNQSLLVVMVVFSLSVYSIIFSGWFSNSKYAIIGSCRALAQSISYEIGLSTLLVVLCVIFSSSSLLFFQQIQNLVFLVWPLLGFFLFFFLTFLAELNRSPFDLAEGESELVSGYSVEYGGLSYTLIFLGENMALLWSSALLGFLFSYFFTGFFVFIMVWIRASEPRIRFDKLMFFFWADLLPLILGASLLKLAIL
nr:NADH dehydrogenase subunit 1 [Osculotes curta]